MKDLLLINDTTDKYHHDLFYANYDLALVEDIENVRQQLSIRLQFFYDEWFLDSTEGIKYYDVVFVKVPNLDLIASIIKTFILNTEDVLELLEYTQEFSRSLRKLTITFKVNTTFGELTVTETVGA
jgi:hypothetical protein